MCSITSNSKPCHPNSLTIGYGYLMDLEQVFYIDLHDIVQKLLASWIDATSSFELS